MRIPNSTFTGDNSAWLQSLTHHPNRAITAPSNHPLRVMSPCAFPQMMAVQDD